MEIRLAENGDLSGWVQLVEPMRHLFPGLETPESVEGYARDIAGAISRQEALCAVENGILQWADERKEEIYIYHEASETAPDEFPEGWYADPLHDVISSFRESEEAQKLVEDAFKENQVDILAFQEDDSFGRYGLDSGRYHQMLKTLEWDEETIWKAVWAYGVQACNRGYVVSEYNNTGLYDIERIEKIGVFADNA